MQDLVGRWLKPRSNSWAVGGEWDEDRARKTLVGLAVCQVLSTPCGGAWQSDGYNFQGAQRGPSLEKVDEYDCAWVSPNRLLVFTHNYQSLLPTEQIMPDAPPVNPSRFMAVTVGFPNGPFTLLQPFNSRFADLLHGNAMGVIWAKGPLNAPPADPGSPVDHKETRWVRPR